MVRVEDAVVVTYGDGGREFQVLADPDLILKFRENPQMDPFKVVAVPEVFRDARKADKASEAAMQEIFETDDPREIITIILQEGRFSPTAEQKKAMREKIRKQVINHIARNAVDPRTGTPHPPNRIENAMEQAKVHVDMRPASEQISEVVKALLPILPLKFGSAELDLFIPMTYASRVYGKLKGMGTTKQEKWLADGLKLTLEVPKGMKGEVIDTVNGMTSGEATIAIK